MSFENRKWVIIVLSEHSEDELDRLCANAIQTSASTLRKSVDGTKAILKWDGDTPTVFDGMATFSHSEILEELAKAEWTAPDA
tara:strand:- start:634 stop:882 length:249 start_codon:yes stop_codon:yes gene_type:complete